MLSTVMFACIAQIGEGEKIRELRAALEARCLFHDDVHSYALAYAERTFALGWALRGNPDLLATLPKEE
jgi:hypothetical protein